MTEAGANEELFSLIIVSSLFTYQIIKSFIALINSYTNHIFNNRIPF